MIFDKLTSLVCYTSISNLNLALSFLQNLEPDIACGKYEIDGAEVFAEVFETTLKSKDDAVLESHKQYIDLHTVIVGSERHECFFADELAEAGKYDFEKDCQLFNYPETTGAAFVVTPGTFAVFFPQDAHMTQLASQEKDIAGYLKKVVIKIKVNDK